MAGLAALLIALGVVVSIWAVLQKLKARRVASAPFAKTGEVVRNGASVAGDKGAISVEGRVSCAQPLVSPVTGTRCLYYELKVVGSWKEGNDNKSQEFLVERKAAAFGVDDGSGTVNVNANAGGDFEPLTKTFDETKKEGLLTGLKGALKGKAEPMQFGQYLFQHPTLSKADKYVCTEYVLKEQPQLFVLGKHEGNAITSPSWRSLVLSAKSRDEVLGSAARGAKRSFIGAGGLVAAGILLGVISNFVGHPSEASTAGTPVAAADQAPTADVKAEPQQAQALQPDVQPGAMKEGSDICERATKCCQLLGGKNKGCDALATASEPTCEASFNSFKRALKGSHSKHANECR